MRAAAAEATAVGVCQDVAESLAEARLTSRALADDAAAAALGASAAADAADGRLASRGAALASARAAADDARARFWDAAVAVCEASAPGNARETTFTLDADARVGRRLAAALGPASASPAFAKGVTPAFRLKPGLHVVLAVSGRGLSRDGEAPRRESAAPPTLAELVATAVPPAPREGDAADVEETRASAAADAAAASAAAGNAFDAPSDASRFDTLPESAFSSPSHYDEDREDDRNRDRERDGSSARDRRGSIGAARRAARGATAESIAEWARRARDKGLVPVADPGSNVSEAAGETSVTTHRHRPVQGSRPAPSSEGAFNSVFRPRAEREAPRPDPPLSAETETTPGKTPRATQTQTQTQLLGRFVRAQRACARAELVTRARSASGATHV